MGPVAVDVTDFLQALFLAGWFQGSTPNDAYFVRCDQTTMTAQDIAEGRTIILVGFAPLTPGEFVVLSDRAAATAEHGGVAGGTGSAAAAAPQPQPRQPEHDAALRPARGVAGHVFASTILGGRLVRTLAGGARWRRDTTGCPGTGVTMRAAPPLPRSTSCACRRESGC